MSSSGSTSSSSRRRRSSSGSGSGRGRGSGGSSSKRKEERKRTETKAKESRKLYIYTILIQPCARPCAFLRLPWKNHVFLPYRITKVTPPLNLLQGGLEPPCMCVTIDVINVYIYPLVN